MWPFKKRQIKKFESIGFRTMYAKMNEKPIINEGLCHDIDDAGFDFDEAELNFDNAGFDVYPRGGLTIVGRTSGLGFDYSSSFTERSLIYDGDNQTCLSDLPPPSPKKSKKRRAKRSRQEWI